MHMYIIIYMLYTIMLLHDNTIMLMAVQGVTVSCWKTGGCCGNGG